MIQIFIYLYFFINLVCYELSCIHICSVGQKEEENLKGENVVEFVSRSMDFSQKNPNVQHVVKNKYKKDYSFSQINYLYVYADI